MCAYPAHRKVVHSFVTESQCWAVVCEVVLHTSAHDQRGEASRRQQQSMQPVASSRRPPYRPRKRMVVLEGGSGNRGIRFRHDSWMAPTEGPSPMLLHGGKTPDRKP